MFDQARNQLFTFRDLLRFAVSRFNEAGIFAVMAQPQFMTKRLI